MAKTMTYRGVAYTNGNLPKHLLGLLDGNNLALPSDPARLRLDAAESWNRARAAVPLKTGVVHTVRGGNRSLAAQEKILFQTDTAANASPCGDYRVHTGVRTGRTNVALG